METNKKGPMCGTHRVLKEWRPATFSYTEDGITVSVSNIFAWVCPQDGEASFTPETADDLFATVRDLLAPAKKNPPVEELPDAEVLALTELRLTAREQAALSELLECNREGCLDSKGQLALDDLMRVYEAGLLRKSQALCVAVQRGLLPAID